MRLLRWLFRDWIWQQMTTEERCFWHYMKGVNTYRRRPVRR